MISLDSGRTEQIVELSMSCTVAEFNAARASFVDPNGVPLIALTHLAVASPDARLRLDGRDVGPVNDVCRAGNVLPVPAFREGLASFACGSEATPASFACGSEATPYAPARTGDRHPEPVTRTVPTNRFHEMLQRSGLEMPDPAAGYVSVMDSEALKIEGADPQDRVEMRGVNVRGKAHGIEFWVYV